jgi:hypothetical protein
MAVFRYIPGLAGVPSIEEIEDSVAGTPAKPGIYSIINNKLNV